MDPCATTYVMSTEYYDNCQIPVQYEEKEAFYEKLNAVQERLSKDDLAVLIGDLIDKAGPDNTSLEHGDWRNCLRDRNDNGETFAASRSFKCLILVLHYASTQPAVRSVGSQLTTSRSAFDFRNCLRDMCNNSCTDVGLEQDHHLMIHASLTVDSGIEKRRQLKALILSASDDKCDAFELRYCGKFRKVKGIYISHQKELAGGGRFFDGPVTDIHGHHLSDNIEAMCGFEISCSPLAAEPKFSQGPGIKDLVM